MRTQPSHSIQLHRHARRLLASSYAHMLLLTTGLAIALHLLFTLSPAAVAAVQEPKDATVIVQFDDAARVIRPITFTDAISGLAALERSGLDVVTQMTDFGPLVCSIEGFGCPADDCFCGGDTFWNYTYWDGAQWQSYPVGAGSSVISQTGAVEGWRWGTFGPPQAEPTPAQAAAEALVWLRTRQEADGGYGSIGASVEMLLALGANHLEAAEWRPDGGPSLADFIATQAITYSKANAASAGKLAVGLAGADLAVPPGFATPDTYYDPAFGAYSSQAGPHSWAMLGTVALDQPLPLDAISHLQDLAKPGGGWEWAPGWGVDTNTTALAIQALVAAGERVCSAAIQDGLAFLKSVQRPDGGFPYDAANTTSDANSTAYAVQALYAAGEDPTGPSWTAQGGTPIDYLLDRRLEDGSFEWQPGTGANPLATQQVVPALLGRAHPATVTRAATCRPVFVPLVAR